MYNRDHLHTMLTIHYVTIQHWTLIICRQHLQYRVTTQFCILSSSVDCTQNTIHCICLEQFSKFPGTNKVGRAFHSGLHVWSVWASKLALSSCFSPHLFPHRNQSLWLDVCTVSLSLFHNSCNSCNQKRKFTEMPEEAWTKIAVMEHDTVACIRNSRRSKFATHGNTRVATHSFNWSKSYYLWLVTEELLLLRELELPNHRCVGNQRQFLISSTSKYHLIIWAHDYILWLVITYLFIKPWKCVWVSVSCSPQIWLCQKRHNSLTLLALSIQSQAEHIK